MYGNDPVRLLYKTHVRLSANAEKQKIFPTELSLSLMMIEGPCLSGPAWNDGTDISSIQLSLSATGAACTMVGPGLAEGGCRGCRVVVLGINLMGQLHVAFCGGGTRVEVSRYSFGG